LLFFNMKQVIAEEEMKLDLLYNPAAGSFRQADLEALARAFEMRGCAVDVTPTRPKGTELSGNADMVCVMGGDGALRQVVKAMGADAGRVPLCIAPAGTINLVARELGYRRKREEFAEQVLAAWQRGSESWMASPLFAFADHPIIACLSIGPDSAAVANLDPALKMKIGRYAYGAAAFRLLRDWPRRPVAVSGELADGTLFECEAEGVFVARGRYYAGPFSLSRRAALTSETFELVTLKRASRRASLAFGSALAARLPLDRIGLAEIRTVRRVALEDSGLPMQVDGDSVPLSAGEVAPSGMTLKFCV
jgi:diacylglycerol kinase family enzyme